MPTLSTLPNELKLHILQRTPDLPTLFALARTSSTFWHLYHHDRQVLTTATAIAQLHDHGIDVMHPLAILELPFKDGFIPTFAQVKKLLRELHRQNEDGQDVRLSVRECIVVVMGYLYPFDDPYKYLFTADRSWGMYDLAGRALSSDED